MNHTDDHRDDDDDHNSMSKETHVAAELAAQFSVQGIRHEPRSHTLWCSLCTTHHVRTHNTSESKADFLVALPEATQEAVLRHCASGTHLRLFEQYVPAGSLEQWLPVELHGRRVLLDHHCLYPQAAFGPGRLLLDETLCGGAVLGEDVCGGVKLWPQHKYSVVELVLPAAEPALSSTATQTTTTTTTASEEEGDGNEQSAPDTHAGQGHTPTRPSHLPAEVVYYEPASLPTHVRSDLERLMRAGLQNTVPCSGVCAASSSPSPEVNDTDYDEAAETTGTHEAQCNRAQRILPSFAHVRQSVHSRRAHCAASATELLSLVNACLRGEAALRRQRRRRFLRENYAKPL